MLNEVITMTENLAEKTLTVTSVNIITELATGELINQVTFGYNIENTGEILGRIPSAMRENFLGKQLVFNELSLLFKAKEVPYKIGSKWKLKLHKNGTINLVKEK